MKTTQIKTSILILLTLFVMLSTSAAVAQTVTTSGGTANSVPKFSGTYTLVNSAITESNGNVGIGTTSPAYTLDVAGIVRNTSTALFGASDYSLNGPILQVGDGQYGLSSYNGALYLWDPGSGVYFQHKLSLGSFGYLSSFRAGQNNYTNLFLGGSIFDNANGTYTVTTDGGSNYFAAIRMDGSGGGAGAINFYTAPTVGGYSYTLLNDQLAQSLRMTIIGGNVGIGTTAPGAKLEINGNLKLSSGSGASLTFPDGTVQSTAWSGTLCGGDYAESVDITGERTQYEPGDVLVVDPDHPGRFIKASERYSTSVAGIYSTKPGLIGRRQTVDPKLASTEVPMAMVGVVPTKVSAENGPIHPGDVLVTSSSSGRAMKGTDRTMFAGAIVGKALGSQASGVGVIEVLVTLQ